MNWNFLQKQRAAISKVLAAAIVCTSAFHPVTTLPVYATDSVVSIDHKTKNLDDVQIHISSETMEIKPGNDIFLQVYIQNNTDHSIENGVLAWSDPDCVLENAYFNPSDEEDSVWISESEFLYGINLLPGDILNTSFSGTLDSFINVDEQCNIEFIFSSGEQNWQENFSFTSGIVNLLPIEPDHCKITAGELGSIALTFAINPSDIIIDLDSVPVSTPSNTNKYNNGTPSNATPSNATLFDANPVDINLFSLEKVMLNLKAFGFKFKNLYITDISFSEMMEYANVTAEYTIDNDNMSGEYFCAINADIIISGINYQCGNLIRFNLISEENTQISTPSNSTGTDEFSHIYITYLDEINCLKDLDIQHNELINLAQELQVRITDDYENDIISEAEYDDLTYMLVDFVYGGTGSIAEFAYGQDLIDPLIEEELTTQIPAYTSKLRSFRLIEDSGTKSISLYNTNDLEPTTSDSDTLPLSSAQIISPGGETVSDDQKVSVSKVITGSDTENTFDITLSVTTKEKIEEIINEPDLAVVLVMDISNSMNTAFGSTSRYAAAMTSAESFLDKFTSEAGNISKVGFVAFNTSAHKIFDLQLCNTAAISESLKTTMNEKTKSIVKASDYASSNTRYTNIEAGLSMAYDMLKEANNSSKYIVFLSDGFPTTYMKSGTTTYTGYNPVSSSGTVNNDGVFYDGVLKAYCQWGTSYSDKAAIKARNIASTIKNDDIVIFSIGVDVSGQTIKQYITQSEGFSGVSVVDRGNISEDEFEIGASSDTAAFATWLKGDENDLSVGIGSGYYYDSSDEDGLKQAYDDIFDTIINLRKEASLASWVAKDPIPTITGSPEIVDFIGFYDINDELIIAKENNDGILEVSLSGSNTELDENTVRFDFEEYAINWDIKNSGFRAVVDGDTTEFFYKLKYQIRLRTESGEFESEKIYPTNSTTILNYNIIEEIDGETVISESQELEFTIPTVTGYQSEFQFKKLDVYENPLPGVIFYLAHDQAECPYCQEEHTVIIEKLKAESQEDGTVLFSNIPSGHIYQLQEEVPAGYVTDDFIYTIDASFGTAEMTVKTQTGSEVQWNGYIINTPVCEIIIQSNTDMIHNSFGRSTFLYLVQGSDCFGREQRWVRSITAEDTGSSVIISGIPSSDENGYSVTEISSNRYAVSDIHGINYIPDSEILDKRTIILDLYHNISAEVLFEHELSLWNNLSHAQDI